MHCQICNTEMSDDALFCPQCGERKKPAPVGAGAESNETGTERFRRAAGEKMDASSGGNESELPLWQGGYSWKAMVGGWVLSLIITVFAFIGGAFAGPVGLLVAALVSLAMWGGQLVMFFYQRLSVEYKLTSQRFVHGTGLLQRTTDRIEVIDIDDVQVTQSFVERMLGIGTIRLLSTDSTTPKLEMKGIDDVTRVATLIDDTRRTERRKRSLHIEAV